MRKLGIVHIAAEVAIDAQPVHLAPRFDLFFADDRDVIFRLAGDDAGVTADTGVQVDAHAPGIIPFGRIRIERGLFHLGITKRWVLLIIVQRPRVDQIAPLHREMVLRRRQLMAPARALGLQTAAEPGSPSQQRIGVEARAAADLSGLGTPVAERDRDAVVSLPRQDQTALARAARRFQRHEVTIVEAEPLCRRRANQRGIVPGQFGERLGQFLQPTVVVEFAVPESRVRDG